ncbi:MAG: hypothetical protein JSR37_00790 [Verrucomicrobia bacterium]|nr:hypothetical protein [Verrucomicrobiota bacterium]MBS0637532.1 hypothetical protein [Verrucomicrobiota bacterium]
MAIPIICYIACHGASSDHFATFIQNSVAEKVEIRVYATSDMAKKFKSVTRIFTFDEDAGAIAQECQEASLVITDVGHQFSAAIQKALELHAPKTRRFAYYDNPETYVPGGYSETAKSVMQAAQGVLFANANLATQTLFARPNEPIDLSLQEKVCLGYYPLAQAERILEQRKNPAEIRAKFFETHQIIDTGQRIVVYFGGNNEEYFEKAFPAFVTLLDKSARAENDLFILQQHPAAKKLNRDVEQLARLQKIKVIVSTVGSDIVQVIADLALYYQTSMGPQFVLAGIPTSQIGHERYEDVLVRNSLINSITTPEELEAALGSSTSQKIPREQVLAGLGITPEWPNILHKLYCKN